MLSISTGAIALRSDISDAPIQANPNRVERVVRANLADAQAALAAALVSGKGVSELREEAANQQAALDAFAGEAETRKAFSPVMSAGRVALGVTAQAVALSR